MTVYFELSLSSHDVSSVEAKNEIDRDGEEGLSHLHQLPLHPRDVGRHRDQPEEDRLEDDETEATCFA